MIYHQQFRIVFSWSAWLAAASAVFQLSALNSTFPQKLGHSCCWIAQRSDFWVPWWAQSIWTIASFLECQKAKKTKQNHEWKNQHPNRNYAKKCPFFMKLWWFSWILEFSDNTRSQTRMSLPALVLDGAMLEAVAWDRWQTKPTAPDMNCEAWNPAWWNILKY